MERRGQMYSDSRVSWLGDDLITSSPDYAASSRLVSAITNAGMSGITALPLRVSFLENVKRCTPELIPLIRYAGFRQLKVTGAAEILSDYTVVKWSDHDICFAKQLDPTKPDSLTYEEMMQGKGCIGDFLVSEWCMNLLEHFDIGSATIKPLVYHGNLY